MAPRVRSLRGRLRRAFAITLAVAIMVVIGGLIAFDRLLDARHRVIDRADPATLEAEMMLVSLLDQETGIRAYALTAADSFLDPYRTGVDAEATSFARLQDLLRGEGRALGLLDDVGAASARWHTEYAAPTIAGIGAGQGAEATASQIGPGRALFDELRSAVSDLQAELLARARGRSPGPATAPPPGCCSRLVALGAVSTVAVGALYLTVRRRVEEPLQQLGENAAAVRSGDLEHPIDPVGDAEFRALAGAMEQMRTTIIAEYLEAVSSRDEIERQAVDLERSNAELEQFAYVASHDLQEPLRKVSAFCQLLQQRYGGQLDERADQYIEFAVDGAKRMQSLINDLLAFSRVGRSGTEPSVAPAGELVREAIDNLSQAIAADGATIEVGALPSVEIERPLGVAAVPEPDRQRDQVPPARRRAPRRGHGPAGRRPRRVRRRDNGIGIEPEYADRVFVIFQRLHTKEAYAGTGIGLAMCRKIVERHGGTICVDTSAPIGTTIRFTLPATDSENANQT